MIAYKKGVRCMKKGYRVTIVTFLVCCCLFLSAGVAFAGTITVNLSPKTGQIGSAYPYLKTANIYVYGPKGYYGNQWCAGSVWAPITRTYVFKNCPDGPYRVRVVWTGRPEANQYPTLNWWSPNANLTFRSPD
jgi:hypothetical protein